MGRDVLNARQKMVCHKYKCQRRNIAVWKYLQRHAVVLFLGVAREVSRDQKPLWTLN